MTSYLRAAYSQTFDSPAFPMSLTIRSAVSGEVIAELQAEAFSDKPARLLKNSLLPKIGYSRFCQRLLVDSTELSDDDVVTVTCTELQLVFVPFCETSPEDYWQLGRACRGGFVDELEELLAKPINPNVTDGREPAIQSAAAFAQVRCVELLLEAGALADIKYTRGFTALHAAANSTGTGADAVEVMHLLLASGLGINSTTDTGWAPLHHAAMRGHLEVVRGLLESGCNKDLATNTEGTALHLSLQYRHVHVAMLLLHAGVKFTSRTSDGHTPLHYAARAGYMGPCRFLLNARADKNSATSKGDTPLHLAAASTQVQIVSLLCEAKAQKNATNERGVTPLHLAVRSKYEVETRAGPFRAAEVLLKKGAHRNKLAEYSVEYSHILDNFTMVGTPLGWATYSGNLGAVRTLIDAGAKTDKAGADGRAPLHFAALCGRLEIARSLIKGGANTNKTCQNGATALHTASALGLAELVDLLLKSEANVNQTCNIGETPLHWAASAGRWKVSKILLEAGAKMEKRSKNGETPEGTARRNQHPRVASLLVPNPKRQRVQWEFKRHVPKEKSVFGWEKKRANDFLGEQYLPYCSPFCKL